MSIIPTFTIDFVVSMRCDLYETEEGETLEEAREQIMHGQADDLRRLIEPRGYEVVDFEITG